MAGKAGKRAAKAKQGARRKPVLASPVPAPAARKRLPRTGAPAAHDTLRDIEHFLYRQAELLDRRRWRDFIELFTEDGVYWMPAAPEQTTGEGVPSIFYEDRNLMTVRMKRVTHPHAWSQSPMWGTSHIVGNVAIEKREPRSDIIVARSRFHMMEFRRDSARHFAGTYLHHLRKTPAGYRIKLQRVDMVNAQGPYDYVLQVWV